MSRKILILVFLGAMALSFLLYGNTIGGGFVQDDAFFAIRPELRLLSHLPHMFLEPVLPDSPTVVMYRPLTYASFSLNFIIFGESPVSFHVVNIILNGLVVFLVFLLTYKLFSGKILSFFTAVIFAFLPIRSEAVANIKSREELLAALFILLSWVLFEKSIAESKYKHSMLILSSLSFFCALLSKEFALVAPFLFLATAFTVHNLKFKNILKLSTFFIIPMAVYILIRNLVFGKFIFKQPSIEFISNPILHAPFFTALWTALKFPAIYLWKTIFPINLSASYQYNQIPLVDSPFHLLVLSGILLLVLFVWLAISKRTKSTPLSAGALAFLILYAPFSQLLVKGGDMFAERWMYLPSMGIALIGGWLMVKFYHSKKLIALTAGSVILIFYTAIIISRNTVWASNETLFNSMVITSPDSVKGYADLGYFYLDKGDLENTQKYLDGAFAITDQYGFLYVLAGGVEYQKGNYNKAEVYLKKAFELSPDSIEANVNLILTLSEQSKFDEAVMHLYARNLVSRTLPASFDSQSRLLFAYVLAKDKKYNECIEFINRNLSNSLQDPQIRYLLAIDYYRIGSITKAKEYFDFSPNLNEAEKIYNLNKF